MKIIELLNKIANGEEVPNEIKYNNYLYYWHSHMSGYFRSIVDSNWVAFERDNINIFNILNDEVEIIEEDKKIEEIKHKINHEEFFNLSDKRKFDYLYEIEARIIDYLMENNK